jgi:hypothetical protein
VKLAQTLLLLVCACGKVTTDDAGTLDRAQWGSACNREAGTVAGPPCTGTPDGQEMCRQWAAGVGDGGTTFSAACVRDVCTLVPGDPCTPGPEGDRVCREWFQRRAPNAIAHGVCEPTTRSCVPATQCTTAPEQGTPVCKCGTNTNGDCSAIPGLCFDVGGTPTCGPQCK